MKRVFVYQDFKSQKFWSIDVRGTDVIVNYGKLGTTNTGEEFFVGRGSRKSRR